MNISMITLRMVKESSVSYDARKNITDPKSVYELLVNALDFGNMAEEQFYMIALDSSIVHPREVFKRALLNNASSIIVAHNHPSGNPSPSKADIDITKRLVDAGVILGIRLTDHIIVGNDKYVSLKQEGVM